MIGPFGERRDAPLFPAGASAAVKPDGPLPGLPRPVGVPTAISGDLLALPTTGQSRLLLALVGLVAAFIGWAAFAAVVEVTTGSGKVIPASRIQVVQNLEGGIVREILVREGQRVTEGDVIARIDPTIAGSSLGEAREKLQSLQALVIRLEAEIEGRALAFPEDLKRQRPDLIAHQREHFEVRRAELAAALNALSLQQQQRAQEIVELRARAASLGRSLEIAREEYGILKPLERQKAAARSEILASAQKVNDLEGQLQAAQLSLPRIEAARQEAADRREERLGAFRSDALQRLSAARTELASLGEASRSSEDKVARTTVRAPATGIVKAVHVTTPGQVIQPGHSLIEIVPLNDTLLIEAQVRPQDIAFLRPGQEALVKITAYDFSLYGGLKGRLEGIGADSTTNDKGDTYYLIRVRTDRAHIERGAEQLPIIPGMVAEVDIVTGSKTVLRYLMKPLTRIRENALTER